MTETEPQVQSVPGWTWGIFIVVVIIILAIWGIRNYNDEKSATAVVTAPQRRRLVVVSSIIDTTTPATLTLDYHFRIESDDPVNIQYPGEKPVLYVPGRGFQQLPQPKKSGPKVFTDPRDPSGHVGFRIYPVP